MNKMTPEQLAALQHAAEETKRAVDLFVEKAVAEFEASQTYSAVVMVPGRTMGALFFHSVDASSTFGFAMGLVNQLQVLAKPVEPPKHSFEPVRPIDPPSQN